MLRAGQEMHIRYMRVSSKLSMNDYPNCGLSDRGIVGEVRILKRRLGVGGETNMLSRMIEDGYLILPGTIYYLTEQDAIDGIDRGHAWEQRRDV